MNYEKKYLEALEKARQFSEHPLQEDSSSIVEYIFPELKEDEDEKIRKALIKYCKLQQKANNIGFCGISLIDIIAWLEKQGEKTINQPDFEIPFGAKDSELIEESYYIPKGYHAEISKDKVTIKKGEQKPSLSEDDEKNLQGIIDEIQANKSSAPSYDINVYDRYLSWLKSL